VGVIPRAGSIPVSGILGTFTFPDMGRGECPPFLSHNRRSRAAGQAAGEGGARTPEEWERCDDPAKMLAFLRTAGGASDRKLRRFACACCRRIGDVFTEERSRKAIEAGARFADRLLNQEVADLATPNTSTRNGYTVTQLWSNEAGKVVKP
jgi:hypothetical protein